MCIIKYSNRKILLITLLIVIISIFPITSFAAGGDGSGGGGGDSIPLSMADSIPKDGEANVDTNIIIECIFSHNVADANIAEGNTARITLTTASGDHVLADVTVADVQIEVEKRRIIYITPIEPLAENEVYVVTMRKGITARNGMETEEDQTFIFTTGDTIDEDVSASYEDTRSKDLSDENTDEEKTKIPVRNIVIVVVIVLIVMIVLPLIVKIRKNKKYE